MLIHWKVFFYFVRNTPLLKLDYPRFLIDNLDTLKPLIPHNVCVCAYHENIQLLLVALHGHTNLPLTYDTFVDQVTCHKTMKICIYHQCLSRKNPLDKFVPSSDNNHQLIKYFQCQTTPREEKIEMKGTIQDQLKGSQIHQKETR